MVKSKENLSLDEEVELYGIKIRKMSNGQYFKALKLIKELPESFVKEILENNKELKLSDMLDAENIASLVGTLLTILPEFTFKFLAKLLDIDKKVLEEKLTPTQTIEIIKKFYEINDLESFFIQMKSMMVKITTLIGFKEQLPYVSK